MKRVLNTFFKAETLPKIFETAFTQANDFFAVCLSQGEGEGRLCNSISKDGFKLIILIHLINDDLPRQAAEDCLLSNC